MFLKIEQRQEVTSTVWPPCVGDISLGHFAPSRMDDFMWPFRRLVDTHAVPWDETVKISCKYYLFSTSAAETSCLWLQQSSSWITTCVNVIMAGMLYPYNTSYLSSQPDGASLTPVPHQVVHCFAGFIVKTSCSWNQTRVVDQLWKVTLGCDLRTCSWPPRIPSGNLHRG